MAQPERQLDLLPKDDAAPLAGQTLDIAGAEHITEICRQFDAAWRKVLAGGPAPAIDAYLELGSESEREALEAELSGIQRSYERLIPSPQADSRAVTGEFGCEAPAAAAAYPTARLPAAGELDGAEFIVGPPVVRVAGYEVLGRLGHGGMGVVYRARQTRLDRVVALKMVLAGAHASLEHLTRFRAEAHAVARLQHPNIVQIHEVGEQDGLPYFSLEYVDGGSLAQKLGGQPRPVQEAAHLVEILARAIDYAHQHGVVHRDLKPANILLTEDGVPKVTDFGLAKRIEVDSTQTRTGTIMGTPSYMAPEQARGDHRETGPVTDIYALGAILYEALTGRPPFVAATPGQTILKVLNEEPVPPTRLRPGIPRDLETICLKCLQKDPVRRYPLAADLADDLHRFLADQPIRARPVSRSERLWRLCRRNPTVAGLTAALAVALVVGTVVSTGLAVRATAAAHRANEEADRADREARAAAERAEVAAIAQKQAEEEQKKTEKARRETAVARDAAAASAEVASRQRELALSTLNTLVTQVQNQLQDTPDTHKLKQALLQTAINGLQVLARESDRSPAVDLNMAEAHRRMGDLFQTLGRVNEARVQYQKMQAITAAQLDLDPLSAPALRNESIALALIGDTHLLLGDPGSARVEYEKALAIRRKLADADRATPSRKVDLAQIYTKLGDVSPLAEARSYHTESLTLREELADGATGPTATASKRDVWISRSRLADLGLRARDLADARLHAAECVKIANELAAQSKTVRSRLDQAISLSRLGLVLRRSGERAEADRQFATALRLLKVLADRDPQNLALQSEYALTLAHAGRHGEAAGAVGRLRGRVNGNPNYLYNLACCYAECEVAAGPSTGAVAGMAAASCLGYSEKSLTALRDAVKAGFKDVELARTDPDLDPIRSHPTFDAILATARPRPGK